MGKNLGDRGETLATEFLRRSGYEIVERNYRHKRAEIDIVAGMGTLLVFCEVKTRKSRRYGSGEEAVDARKQAQIRKAAEGFISERKLEDREFRFDVIVVEVASSSTIIRHIKEAF